MKRFLMTFALACSLLLAVPTTMVHASTLDEVVGENKDSDTVDDANASSSDGIPVTAEEYMQSMENATGLSETSAGADKINQGIKKVASFLVQVLSYFLTALLVVRVLIDLIYIALPFTRNFLANGHQGNAQAGGQPGMQGGMGGMQGGMGGMGGMQGGYGMRGGMGGYGMHGGMGGMGMQGGMQGQQGMTVQWVSTAALNAAASEQSGMNALKLYAKEMAIVLIITPVLLTLAVTGVLTNLGFLIGEVIARGIASVGNMI